MLKYVASISLALCLLAGCGDSGSTGGTTGTGAANKMKIAVIAKGTTGEFWTAVEAGARKAEKEAGNIEVIWKAPAAETDRASQINIVQDMIHLGVAGICLAPLDAEALKEPAEQAIAQKIPVVVFDSNLSSDKTTSFVATDNQKGGQVCGETMVKLLNGKGRLVMMRFVQGSASTNDREEYFLKAIAGSPEIKVLSENQYAGDTVAKGQNKAESLLAAYKKADGSLDLEAVFAPNDPSVLGMLLALQGMKQAGKVHFVGFDASANTLKALEDGEIDALVVQNPFNMGYLAVKTMVDHLAGKEVPKRIDTGLTVVTKANMNSPEVQAVLHPKMN